MRALEYLRENHIKHEYEGFNPFVPNEGVGIGIPDGLMEGQIVGNEFQSFCAE